MCDAGEDEEEAANEMMRRGMCTLCLRNHFDRDKMARALHTSHLLLSTMPLEACSQTFGKVRQLAQSRRVWFHFTSGWWADSEQALASQIAPSFENPAEYLSDLNALEAAVRQTCLSVLQHLNASLKSNKIDLVLASLRGGGGADPSVLDVFHYPNNNHSNISSNNTTGSEFNMGPHTDPGLMTAKIVSNVLGLQLFDECSSEWLDVDGAERLCPAGGAHLVIFAGDALEAASFDHVPSVMHRVAIAPRGRTSIVFELRTAVETEERCSDDAHRYMVEFIEKRLSQQGATRQSLLAEFGVVEGAPLLTKSDVSTDDLANFLVTWVANSHDQVDD
eukprot:c5902_g1_i1.p1 GENE.c5902_g1_i1~~c5902_g1_i1.p1  ORF type:complete len:348 (+),score=69.44 c5902_g1_i1:45-1046(+)